MIAFLFLCLGLVGLWIGTELAVRAALRIAEARGLSQAFVGLTIMAIGTDIPEMVMSIVAALGRLDGTDASGVVVGSAVGSCLGQIGLVLGLAGLSGYLSLGRTRIWTDGVMLLGSIVLFGLVAYDGELTRIEGGILLTTYTIYFITLVRREKSSKKTTLVKATVWKDGALCAVGLVLVTGFSHLVLTNAISLSELWGLGQTTVGLVLVGVGTSLPELALSLTAVRKKAGALSVGNIIGSNVFDILVPPGTAALIAGLEVHSDLVLAVDLPILFFMSLATFVFFTRKRGLQKPEAMILLFSYLLYIALRVGAG